MFVDEVSCRRGASFMGASSFAPASLKRLRCREGAADLATGFERLADEADQFRAGEFAGVFSVLDDGDDPLQVDDPPPVGQGGLPPVGRGASPIFSTRRSC